MAGQPIAPQDPETKREKAAMKNSRPSSLTSPYAMGYTTGASFNSRSEGFGSGTSGRGAASPFRGARRSPVEAASPTAHRQAAAGTPRGSTSHRPSWTPLSDRNPTDSVISLESDDEIEIVDESEAVKRKRRHDLVDPLRLMPDPRQEVSPRKRQHTESRSEAPSKKTASRANSNPQKTTADTTSRNSYSQEHIYPVDCFCIGTGEYYPCKEIDRKHFIVINRSHLKLIREIVPDALSDECTVHLSDCEGYRHYTCASQGKEASPLLALYVKNKTSSSANLINFVGITEDSSEFAKIMQEKKIMLMTSVNDLKAIKEFSNTLMQRPGKMQLRREEVSHPGELVDLGAYQESLRAARDIFKSKKIGHSSGMKRPNESVDASAIGSRKEGRRNSISHFFTKDEKQGFSDNKTGPTPITPSRAPPLSKRDQGEPKGDTSGQSKESTFEESGLEIQPERNGETSKNKDTGSETLGAPQTYGRLVRGRRTSKRKAAVPPEEIILQEQAKTGVINFDNDPIPRETVVIVYPWGEDAKGHSSIQVTHGDRRRLDEGEFLNDTLVEYGLKQLSIALEKRDSALASSVYVFNPYFFQNLSQKSRQPAEGLTLDTAGDEPPFDSYNLVRKWTSKVDIFSKKYVIVPINENFHWYLAIIVNPRGILESQRELMNRVHGARTSERSPPKVPPRRESKRKSKGNKDAGIDADDVTNVIAPDTTHIEMASENSVNGSSTLARNAETLQSPAVGGSSVDDSSQGDVFADTSVAIGHSTHTLAASETAEKINIGSESVPNPDSSDDSASSVSGALNDLNLGDASPLHTEHSFATTSEDVSNSEPTASRNLSSASTDRPPTSYDPERCYVLIFDSLGSAHQAAAKRLKDYLKKEAADKLSIYETSDQKCTAKLVEAPLQPNFCDCGLYVLHYAETFFEEPVEMLNFVMRKKPSGRKLAAFRREIDDKWHAELASVRRKTMREELERLAVEYEEYNRPFAAREEARALRKKQRAERAKDASRVSKVKGKTNEDPECVILDDSDDSDSDASSESEAEDSAQGADVEVKDPAREAPLEAEDAEQAAEAGMVTPMREVPNELTTDTVPAVLESSEESTTRNFLGKEAKVATATSLSSDGDRIPANAGEASECNTKAITSNAATANDLCRTPPANSSLMPLTVEPVSYDSLLQTFDEALSSSSEALRSPHRKSVSSEVRRSQSTPRICIPVTHFLSASESPKEEDYYSMSEAPTLTLDAQESEPTESDADTVQS